MAIPLGASFGLGMLAAGFLAVVFYRRRVPNASLRPGKGARLGVVSGALGFGMFAVVTSIQMVIFHSGDLRAQLLDALQESASRTSDPQAQQMLDYFRTPPGLVLMMIVGLILMFIAFVLFSALGGALGAALLRRRDVP